MCRNGGTKVPKSESKSNQLHLQNNNHELEIVIGFRATYIVAREDALRNKNDIAGQCRLHAPQGWMAPPYLLSTLIDTLPPTIAIIHAIRREFY